MKHKISINHISYLLYKFNDCAKYAIVEKIKNKKSGGYHVKLLSGGYIGDIEYSEYSNNPNFGGNVYGYTSKFEILELKEYVTITEFRGTNPEYFI